MTKSSMFALSKAIGPCTRSANDVLPDWHLEPDRARPTSRLSRGDVLGRQRAAGAVVDPSAARRLRRLALLLQRLGRAVAEIAAAARHELLRAVRDALSSRCDWKYGCVRPAHVGPFVPVEPQPAQAVDDARDHVPGRSLGVGVLDAQHERAACRARIAAS